MSVLANIAYYMTIYIGIPIYIFGFIGSLLNICILYSNRKNPCTFLFIYASVVDCFVLNIGLLPRILANGFHIDPTLSNLLWCKIRTYGLRISTVVSLYTICLMSIDRFFITCRTVQWRQLSNLSFTRLLTALVTSIITLEGLPYCILTKILETTTSISCTPMHDLVFAKYESFFSIPILFGILPLSILISMGILIYYNLHNRIHLRQAQRSLTLIILIRIIIVITSCGPYTSYFVYSAIISLVQPVRSTERLAIENSILSIVSIFLYVTYSISFYVYYFIFPNYRKRLGNLLRRSWRTRQDLNHREQPIRMKYTQTYPETVNRVE